MPVAVCRVVERVARRLVEAAEVEQPQRLKPERAFDLRSAVERADARRVEHLEVRARRTAVRNGTRVQESRALREERPVFLQLAGELLRHDGLLVDFDVREIGIDGGDGVERVRDWNRRVEAERT